VSIMNQQYPHIDDKARRQQLAAFQSALGLSGSFGGLGCIAPAHSPVTIAGETPMLEKLKNLTETLALKGAVDALVELAAYGRMLLAEYEAQKIPAPKWLEPNLKALGQEIRARWQAERRAQLLAAEKDLEELRSREEKRAAKEEEIKRLREEENW